MKKQNSLKVSQIDPNVVKGSRAEKWWDKNLYEPYYLELRPNLDSSVLDNVESLEGITRAFRIKAIGFGNWVTLEDRINYLSAMVVAFNDLNKVLKLGNNIGIYDTLTLTFGARGIPKANAHYEQQNHIINLARYSKANDNGLSKFERMIYSGGIGSFAHEYGHFLDYFAGLSLDRNPKIAALSGGDSTSKNKMRVKGEMREVCDELMSKIIWKVEGKKLSTYYQRLDDYLTARNYQGDYYYRRNELFARAFEAFVMYELKAQGISNFFLVAQRKNKKSHLYLTEEEMKPVAPLFRELLTLIREKLK